MHFSPGKIQQRVRSAQRFSHLKCIEFITYSRPTAAPTYPPVAPPSSTTCFHVLVILAFSSSPRVSSTRSGHPARKRAAENKIADGKILGRSYGGCEVCTGEICAARILVSGTSAFHFRPRILKITAVECIPARRDTAAQISRGESRSRVVWHIPFIPLFFPFPLRKPEVVPVFNDRVTTGKAVATNAKPRGCNEGNARNYKNQLKRRGERNSTRKRQ